MVAMKNEIKNLTNEIKETKAAYKTAQRAYSKQWTSGEFNSLTWYKQPEKYHQIEPTLRFINKTHYNLENLQHLFRVKHIVNSMCKGRTISQIENKVSDNPQKKHEREIAYREAKDILSKINKEWLE